MKRLSVLLAALFFLFCFSFSALAEATEAPHYTLPIDFSPGMPVDQKFYLSDTVYEDPTLKVKITTGDEKGVLYWIADIEIQDPSQLRTVAAEGFDSKEGTEYGHVLAKRVNAVLAVDGDFFNYSRGVPLILRQGVLFENQLARMRGHDILLIDENGDFHCLANPREEDVNKLMKEHKIINAFYFGPILVRDGKICESMSTSINASQFSQRVAIAQTGHLKYRVIVTGPHKRGSKAFKFGEWRRFVAGMEDIQCAYNLDGGDSAVLVFNNHKINDPENSNERQLADIIYFASAWPGD